MAGVVKAADGCAVIGKMRSGYPQVMGMACLFYLLSLIHLTESDSAFSNIGLSFSAVLYYTQVFSNRSSYL